MHLYTTDGNRYHIHKMQDHTCESITTHVTVYYHCTATYQVVFPNTATKQRPLSGWGWGSGEKKSGRFLPARGPTLFVVFCLLYSYVYRLPSVVGARLVSPPGWGYNYFRHGSWIVVFLKVVTVSRRAVSFGMRLDDNRGSMQVLPRRRRHTIYTCSSRGIPIRNEMRGKLGIHFYSPPVFTFPSRVTTALWYIPCDACPQRGIGLHPKI